MAFNLDNLADVLRSRGLNVVEVDGWKYRGYAGQDMQPVRGVLWHHTATGRAAFANNNAPTLNLCTNGRSDLPGPLANIVFGRDGTCYIVATGVANHAGTGSAYGIPVNMGNHYLIGIEMESSGIAPWDWTAEQLREAPKLGAALELAYLQALPADERLQLGHLEYSDAGKIDPAGWPGGVDGLRSSINNQISAWSKHGSAAPLATDITPITEEGFLMALSDADQIEVRDNLRKLVGMGFAEVTRDRLSDAALTEVVGNARKTVYGLADVHASIAALPAADIAAAIPDDLAQQVVDALAERLAK